MPVAVGSVCLVKAHEVFFDHRIARAHIRYRSCVCVKRPLGSGESCRVLSPAPTGSSRPFRRCLSIFAYVIRGSIYVLSN